MGLPSSEFSDTCAICGEDNPPARKYCGLVCAGRGRAIGRALASGKLQEVVDAYRRAPTEANLREAVEVYLFHYDGVTGPLWRRLGVSRDVVAATVRVIEDKFRIATPVRGQSPMQATTRGQVGRYRVGR